MKIVIFGAGKAGKYLYDEIAEKAKNIEVVGFLDSFLEGKYKGKKIYHPNVFFDTVKLDIDAVFIAAGAQKTLKTMINACRENDIDQLYMMHDIAGKCRLPLFDEKGMIETRIRKLRFSNQKPSLSYFEVPITDNCNLNCKGCLFASNMTQGVQHVNLNDLEKDAKRMSELFFDVPWIRILGGEPLMHPNIIEILKSYRRYFPDSEIDLCTNGLLIPRMKKNFWDCIKRERISIHVSGYKPTYDMLDKIDKILREQHIPYVILKRETFLKYYTNIPNHDMKRSFERCSASGCYEVYRGRLSTCSAVIAFEKFNTTFGTSYMITENEDWFNIHNSEINPWKIKEKLESPSCLCKYCSDTKTEIFEWEYNSKRIELSDYIIEDR